MGARGRTPDSGIETANPFNGAGRETPKISLSGTGIIRGKGTEASTGDRKTSGRVGELKEVGLPARWAVFPSPGRGFPAKTVRPLPAMDAQDEGLPVLKGRLKERMGATVFVQPLDLVKNRMQLSGEGAKTREYKTSFHALTSILRAEGLRGIYTGLSAGLLRQATYTTTRLGIYTVLFERLTGADGTPPGFLLKALIGMTAGATGAFVGTPAEVALIRMTADGRLPADQRRGYKNVFNALIRIAREEGVPTLWRGCIPTMARAVVVNAAQLASYSQSKQFLLDSGYFSDNILCHFCASMISGLVTTAASMPVDIVKTRIQNMRMIDGKPEYKNGLDVLVKVVRYEGFFSLWKGFTPYYARLGPHTVLTFIFLEQMNKAYKRLFLSG
ncbi:mitochondrial 2-oxoglutarate/malate carrier protein isoform X3 [Globicephala melas]|uniref:mitochondrial 2-oxoglutarate/malate carrier protein isoform X3 n=1 Tax=Globicephala melas TaxID=9731 RepID=UPI00122ECC94|nr:mitochondrial 2-oxoglutarate/malate carrier protein isoform X3 [Globicephala melas]